MGRTSKSTKLAKASATVASENSKYDAIPEVQKELIAEHLPPIALVFAVVACSGFLFVFAFRDVFATGRNIGGNLDAAYLVSLRARDDSPCFCKISHSTPL
jgi:hypothetical protein